MPEVTIRLAEPYDRRRIWLPGGLVHCQSSNKLLVQSGARVTVADDFPAASLSEAFGRRDTTIIERLLVERN